MTSARRRSTLGLSLLAVSMLGLLSSPSTQAAPAAASISTARIRAEIRVGTAGLDFDSRKICPLALGGCLAEALTTASGAQRLLVSQVPYGYGAGDLAAAYHLPDAGIGAVNTIAIVDAGAYPNLEQDLATYRATYRLPPCTTSNGCLSIANYNGGKPYAPSTSDIGKAYETETSVETALDLDMASAACPSCRLLELQTPFIDAGPRSRSGVDKAIGHFGTAVTTARRLGAAAVSMSYGYPTDSYAEHGTPAAQLRQPGMAVVASSGDSGFNGDPVASGGTPLPGPWPQELDTVTSVGGTSLYEPTRGNPNWTQTAWSGAGSGCGIGIAPPAGQPSGVSAHCGGDRAATDIAAVADSFTGVAVYDTYDADGELGGGGFLVVGGTSASAPFVAGLYARGGHLAGVLGPNTLYRAPAGSFTDVTVGENAGPKDCSGLAVYRLCHAGPGWDGPTGLGTPDGLGGF